MMKKLAAFGISAAIALTPLAAIAQTPTPEESASPAATGEPMKPMKKTMHKKAVHHKAHKAAKKPMSTESPTPSPSAT
jgi:hypothetical protein